MTLAQNAHKGRSQVIWDSLVLSVSYVIGNWEGVGTRLIALLMETLPIMLYVGTVINIAPTGHSQNPNPGTVYNAGRR